MKNLLGQHLKIIFHNKMLTIILAESSLELIPKELQSDILIIMDDSLPELPILDLVNNDRLIRFPARLGEPKTIQVDQICVDLQNNKKLPTSIIGIGGGSTMDVAKAVSLMLTNIGSSSEYQGWNLVNMPGIFKVGVQESGFTYKLLDTPAWL